VLARNLRTIRVVLWVHVSESSVARSAGLSEMNGFYSVVVVVTAAVNRLPSRGSSECRRRSTA